MISELFKLYLSNEKYHLNNSNDIFQNVFEDALRMQGDRVVNNIMQVLKCDRKKAHEIAFCDVY